MATALTLAAANAERALAGVLGWVEGGKDSSAMAPGMSSPTQPALREGA